MYATGNEINFVEYLKKTFLKLMFYWLGSWSSVRGSTQRKEELGWDSFFKKGGEGKETYGGEDGLILDLRKCVVWGGARLKSFMEMNTERVQWCALYRLDDGPVTRRFVENCRYAKRGPRILLKGAELEEGDIYLLVSAEGQILIRPGKTFELLVGSAVRPMCLFMDEIGAIERSFPSVPAYKSVIINGLKSLSSIKAVMREGAYFKLKDAYRHWPVKKNSKKGYRLISAPGFDVKCKSRDMLNVLNRFVPEKDDAVLAQLSYIQGVDYVSELRDMKLSIKDAGNRMLSLDYSDFFTKLSPNVIMDSLESLDFSGSSVAGTLRDTLDSEHISDYIESCGTTAVLGSLVWCAMAEYATFGVKRMSNLLWNAIWEARDVSGNYRVACSKIARILAAWTLTVDLPVWKVALAGKDILGETGQPDTAGYVKYVSFLRKAPLTESPDIKALLTSLKAGPWSVRGIPQGAPYSGTVANWVALRLMSVLIVPISRVVNSFGGRIRKVLLYSDNAFVFYDCPVSCEKIFKRELPEELREARLRDCGRFLYSDKITVTDRTRKDVKVLGVLIDSDGDIRLSRNTRRRLNQELIHAFKDETAVSRETAGRKVWFERVRTLGVPGKYARSLKTA